MASNSNHLREREFQQTGSAPLTGPPKTTSQRPQLTSLKLARQSKHQSRHNNQARLESQGKQEEAKWAPRLQPFPSGEEDNSSQVHSSAKFLVDAPIAIGDLRTNNLALAVDAGSDEQVDATTVDQYELSGGMVLGGSSENLIDSGNKRDKHTPAMDAPPQVGKALKQGKLGGSTSSKDLMVRSTDKAKMLFSASHGPVNNPMRPVFEPITKQASPLFPAESSSVTPPLMSSTENHGLGKPNLKLLLNQHQTTTVTSHQALPKAHQVQVLGQAKLRQRQSPQLPKSPKGQAQPVQQQTVTVAAAGKEYRKTRNGAQGSPLGQLLLSQTTTTAAMFTNKNTSHKPQAPLSNPKNTIPSCQTTKARNSRALPSATGAPPSKLKKTSTRPSLTTNQQPKVGKQQNVADAAVQQESTIGVVGGVGGGGPLFSMTGDIDDVANVVTPSPRRNPGKMQHLQQQQQMSGGGVRKGKGGAGVRRGGRKRRCSSGFDEVEGVLGGSGQVQMEQEVMIVLGDDADGDDGIGSGLLTEESFAPPIERITLNPKFSNALVAVESCDESMNLNEFASTSRVETPSQLALSVTSRDYQTNSHVPDSLTAQKTNSGNQLFQPRALIQQSASISQTQAIAKLGSKSIQSAAKQSSQSSSHHTRQVPHQSSIETKKLNSRHPNQASGASSSTKVKPFNYNASSTVAKQKSAIYDHAAILGSSTSTKMPKTQTRPQTNSKPIASHIKGPKVSDKVQLQRCDLVATTTEGCGDMSDLEMLTSSVDQDNNNLGQRPTLLASDVQTMKEESGGTFELAQSLAIAGQATQATSKQLKKQIKQSAAIAGIQTLAPKQIEIELGFDQKTCVSSRQSEKRVGYKKTGFSQRSPTMLIDQCNTPGSATSAHPAITVKNLHSFSQSNREQPLEEKPPNTTQAKGELSNSLKTKCRQKYLNQTVVQPSQGKTQQHASRASQPIPSIALNSFKTRPTAPVTSRNMSNATSLAKKGQPTVATQVRNPNFKRTAQPLAQSNKPADLTTPQTIQIKTLDGCFNDNTVGASRGDISILASSQRFVPQTATKKSAMSSSVDARRGAFRTRKRTESVPREDTNAGSGPQRLQKVSQANISIDLTCENNNPSSARDTSARDASAREQKNRSASQYKTESLERILGSQAEPYFRQIERTMQMVPVNISQSQQRQASLSQSSRFSGKTTGKDTQISLTMPGGGGFTATSASLNLARTVRQPNQLPSTSTLVLEPRLASADKKNSFDLAKVVTQSAASSSLSLSRPQIERPLLGVINRDRFVAHRRIDLIFDENTDSVSAGAGGGAGGGPKASLTSSLQKDYLNSTVKGPLTRKKSESLSSTENTQSVATSTAGPPRRGPSITKPASVQITQQGVSTMMGPQMTGKPRSVGRKNQLVTAGPGVRGGTKSSFSSNHRLQQSSKQSIVKDWVMCLPNEPPKVIDDTPTQSYPDPPSEQQSRSVPKEPKSGTIKKDIHDLSAGSASNIGRSTGKSLLYPSAQKKIQSRFQLSNPSGTGVNKESTSRESMECVAQLDSKASVSMINNQAASQVTKINPTKQSTGGKQALVSTKTQSKTQKKAQEKPVKKTTERHSTALPSSKPSSSSNTAAQIHQNALQISKQLSEANKLQQLPQGPSAEKQQRRLQNTQRSTSSLLMQPSQVSISSSSAATRPPNEKQETFSRSKGLQNQASASYLNVSSLGANPLSINDRPRPNSRHSLAATSNKDQTSSHHSLRQHYLLGGHSSFIEQTRSGMRVEGVKQEKGVGLRKETNSDEKKDDQQPLSSQQKSEATNQKHDSPGDSSLKANGESDAAKYYDKLTSLFQETRQKLREFNQDFLSSSGGGNRNAVQSLRLKQNCHSSVASADGTGVGHHGSQGLRESLLSELQRRETTKSIDSRREAGGLKTNNKHHRKNQASITNTSQGQLLNGSQSILSSHNQPQSSSKKVSKQRAQQLDDSDNFKKERKSLLHKGTAPTGSTKRKNQAITRQESNELCDQREVGVTQTERPSRKTTTTNLVTCKQAQIELGVKEGQEVVRKQKSRHSSGGRGQHHSQQLGLVDGTHEPNLNEVDNYYHTNDESIDFMSMATRTKPQQRQLDPTASSSQAKNPPPAATKRTKVQKANSLQDTVVSQQTQLENQQPRASKLRKIDKQHDKRAVQSGVGSAQGNATIYINNLLASGQQPYPHQSSQHTMIGLPSELVRAQSQVIYPHQQPQQYSGYSPHSGPPPQGVGIHFGTAQSAQQQQQIVFVPVPMLQAPGLQHHSGATMASVPSAPQFMAPPLTYQYPTQFPQGFFLPHQAPPTNGSSPSQATAALYASAGLPQSHHQLQHQQHQPFSAAGMAQQTQYAGQQPVGTRKTSDKERKLDKRRSGDQPTRGAQKQSTKPCKECGERDQEQTN